MAEGSSVGKVVDTGKQTEVDKVFAQKAKLLLDRSNKKFFSLKKKNNFLGLALAGSVFAIYGYTMFSVRQSKLMEEFDKTPQ